MAASEDHASCSISAVSRVWFLGDKLNGSRTTQHAAANSTQHSAFYSHYMYWYWVSTVFPRPHKTQKKKHKHPSSLSPPTHQKEVIIKKKRLKMYQESKKKKKTGAEKD
jgi:hypothetical protein